MMLANVQWSKATGNVLSVVPRSLNYLLSQMANAHYFVVIVTDKEWPTALQDSFNVLN